MKRKNYARLIAQIDWLLKFAEDSDLWWERPLTNAEKRVNFAQAEKDMGEIIEDARLAMDAEWKKALEKLQAKAEHSLNSPEKLLEYKMDLDGFVDRFVKAALASYRQGEKAAEKELPDVPKGGAKKFAQRGSVEQALLDAGLGSDVIEELANSGINIAAKWKPNRETARLIKDLLEAQAGYETAKGTKAEKVWKTDVAKAKSLVYSSLQGVYSTVKVAKADPLKDYEGILKARAFEVAEGMQEKALGSLVEAMKKYNDEGLHVAEKRDNLKLVFDGLAAGHLIAPGTPGHDYTKPAIQSTTVRTLTNDAMNKGRNEVYERNAGYVLGTERSEIAAGREMGRGRMRSHPLSKWVDGLKIKLEDPRRLKLMGSLHFNERGNDIPLTILDEPVDWSSDADIDRAIAKGRELSPRFF